jgi:hypothetical protein
VLFRRHGEYSRLSSFQTFFIFFIVLVTYSLYPGLTTLITSEGVKAKFFAPAMFLLFILGDLTGRLSCGSLDVRSEVRSLPKKLLEEVICVLFSSRLYALQCFWNGSAGRFQA